jgi:hypothetical protein
LCHQLYLTRQRAVFHPRSNKAVTPRPSPKSSHIPTSSPPLPPPRAPSPPPWSPRATAVAGAGKMMKGIKNREQSAHASNQKRDPTTGRFTRAPDGVVLRRPSAVSAVVGEASLTSRQGSRGSPPIALAPAARH